MEPNAVQFVEGVAWAIEAAGVVVIVIGAVAATGIFLVAVARKIEFTPVYSAYRANLGRAILLGLEFLVAGDIIATILVEPTIENVAALGLIVLIRTFLSFSLETEIQGRFPWRRAQDGGA